MTKRIGWTLALALLVAGCAGDDAGGQPATTVAPVTTTTTAGSATTTRPLYSAETTAPESETTAPDTTAPDTTTAPRAGATITIENFSFGEPVTVSTGETVTIVNEDGVPHTWTAEDGPFDSGTIGGGESFDYVFDQAGDYSFFCEIHPGMAGTITVSG